MKHPVCLVLGFSLTAFLTVLPAQSMQVYFGTSGQESKGIYRSTFDDATGTLSPAQVAAEIGSPGFLALHPNGHMLYAAASFSGDHGAAAYQIRSNGALELVNQMPTNDGSAAHLAVHPSGKFLLTAQYGGGSVALFPLDAAGKLGPAQVIEHEGGSKVVPKKQDSPHPHYVGYSPDGQFALVPDLGLDGIVIYKIDAQAVTITRHGFAPSEPGGGARHLKFSPDGKFIYLLNELTLSMTAFAWDAANGTARQLETVPSISEEAKAKNRFNSGAEILMHPSGRFLYYSNRGHDSVSVYRVDPATAAAEVIQVQPARGELPRNINLTPDGGWLLAAGAVSNTISVHQVNPQTGELTYHPKGGINVPEPICILFVKK